VCARGHRHLFLLPPFGSDPLPQVAAAATAAVAANDDGGGSPGLGDAIVVVFCDGGGGYAESLVCAIVMIKNIAS